jgi:hypothetical protein
MRYVKEASTLVTVISSLIVFAAWIAGVALAQTRHYAGKTITIVRRGRAGRLRLIFVARRRMSFLSRR